MNTKIRLVTTDNGHDAVVSDWYFKKQPQGMQVVKEYATLEYYMQDITDDYTSEVYMSDGECLDLAIKLYDEGIAYL